jgi:predicted neuraminidase
MQLPPSRWFLAFALLLRLPAAAAPADPAILRSEFIYEHGPVPSVHASTIAETTGGDLAAAWFGGTAERNPDVCIWVSCCHDGHWTVAANVADGVQADGKRFATWNPVLFQAPQGPLLLFYKVGPSPSEWWGMLRRSTDGGRSWSEAVRLPPGILGPIKDKPLLLADGTLLCGSSTEGSEHGRQVHFELTSDLGRTWTMVGPISTKDEFGAIQPTFLTHADGRLQVICRSKDFILCTSWSSDQGRTWTKLASAGLYGPDTGLDGVTLADGRQLLVYNPRDHSPVGAPPGENWKSRYPLVVCLSTDGLTWDRRLVLEDEPRSNGYAYPAVIQTSDGLVHVTYTWNRQRIKQVVIDPRRL